MPFASASPSTTMHASVMDAASTPSAAGIVRGKDANSRVRRSSGSSITIAIRCVSGALSVARSLATRAFVFGSTAVWAADAASLAPNATRIASRSPASSQWMLP
ncbi:hypothetical protein [Burkholderia sp. NLJ2]|uniref:hypothetical protein n=1 Tax=Burkholderia sp. NLJ2 TaxID=3090699 RepID=UPI003C6C45F3